MKTILKSIKGRLFLWFFTSASLLLIVLSIFLYHKIKDIVFNSVDQTTHSKVQIIAGLLHEEQGAIKLELSEIVSGEYSIPRSGHYYKVLLDEKVLAASPSLVDSHFDLTSGTLESNNNAFKEKIYLSTGPDNEPIRVLRNDLEFLGMPVSVFSAESLRDSLDMINSFKHFLLIIMPASILIGGVVGLWIAANSLKPLETFSLSARQITYKNMSKRIDAKAHAQELSNLAGSFNTMLDGLQKAFKIENALNMQREKFISVLIHDLKGPLVPILGFTNRLIKGKAKSTEDAIKTLKIVQSSSQELLKTIENTSKDLREKSALQSFHPEEVDFREILTSVATNFIPKIEEKGIEIVINKKDKEHWNELEKIVFKADPSQLKTLVENLLRNAIKYTKSTIEVKLNKDDSGILFVVSDDGPGIPEKYHEKIFEEYFQAPGSKKGTGIGLYSVKKVVENHKGKIIVNSSLNAGASFEIKLGD